MNRFFPPVEAIAFCLSHTVDLEAIGNLPGYEEVTVDLVEAILNEAARYASEILSPLNTVGDREKARYCNGQVFLPTGFADAYRQFVTGGWNNVGIAREIGGQGLPCVVATVLAEIFIGANKSFMMCPGLTQGAVEAIHSAATPELRKIYLDKLVSGRWSATMNLTEPQAGSDLGALRTTAALQPDGSYRIRGQKSFISFGEHDLAENIIHLVLARTPQAPAGVQGISLFLVPKFLPAGDGSLGPRNDVKCLSIEHKLGIHASPTCVMAYGEDEGAIGYLLGEENKGLQAMFVMMNTARLTVGVEGLAIAERAYQQARNYARERIQGKDIAGGKQAIPIISHPDVRRMLLTMRSQIAAMRGLALSIAEAIDFSRHHPDAIERQRHQRFVDIMTPVFKGWASETGVEVASLGMQIHGGVGYVEETGAAQHLRDARISPIYEGTTGIQANDLIGRKMARDGGEALRAVVAAMRATQALLAASDGKVERLARTFHLGIDALERAGAFIVERHAVNIHETAAVAVPFLLLFGKVAGAWQLARQALSAQRAMAADSVGPAFLNAQIDMAVFYMGNLLPPAFGLAEVVAGGGSSVLAPDIEQF